MRQNSQMTSLRQQAHRAVIVALLIISGLLFLPVVALVACMCFLLTRVPWGLKQTDARQYGRGQALHCCLLMH